MVVHIYTTKMAKLNITRQVRRSSRIANLNQKKQSRTVHLNKPTRARQTQRLKRIINRQALQRRRQACACVPLAIAKETTPPETISENSQKLLVSIHKNVVEKDDLRTSKSLEKQENSRRFTPCSKCGPDSGDIDIRGPGIEASCHGSANRGTLPHDSSSPTTPPEPVFDGSKRDDDKREARIELESKAPSKLLTPVILSSHSISKPPKLLTLPKPPKPPKPLLQLDSKPSKPLPSMPQTPKSSPSRQCYEDSTTFLSHPLPLLPLRTKPSLFHRAFETVWRSTCAMVKSIFKKPSEPQPVQSVTSWSSQVPYWP